MTYYPLSHGHCPHHHHNHHPCMRMGELDTSHMIPSLSRMKEREVGSKDVACLCTVCTCMLQLVNIHKMYYSIRTPRIENCGFRKLDFFSPPQTVYIHVHNAH